MSYGISLAILAAALYAISTPFSKILLNYLPSTMMAAFLYLGAGLGMLLLSLLRKNKNEKKLSKKDLPYTIAMVVLDIAAPIFLMMGLEEARPSNVALLNNFEIVATAIIAACVFKEKISPRLILGILFVTLSCCLLSFNGASDFSFSKGSFFVLLAASCWGLENNCTRMISNSDPLQIVLIKGIFSGSGSFVIALIRGERINDFRAIIPVLLLGFVAYGLSIYFYVYAQRMLGASRTGAYYAIAPFIGSFLSLLIFREIPGTIYYIALCLMLIGAWLSSSDTPLKDLLKGKKDGNRKN